MPQVFNQSTGSMSTRGPATKGATWPPLGQTASANRSGDGWTLVQGPAVFEALRRCAAARYRIRSLSDTDVVFRQKLDEMAAPDDPRTMDTMLIGQLTAYLTGFWPDGRPVGSLELADATKAQHALTTMNVAGTPPLSDDEQVVALALFRKPAGTP